MLLVLLGSMGLVMRSLCPDLCPDKLGQPNLSVATLPPVPDSHLAYEGNWLSSFSPAARRLGQLEAASHNDAGTISHVGVPGSWGQSLWASDCGGGKRGGLTGPGQLATSNNLIFLQKRESSQMSFSGQFKHLIVSLLTFLLMNVNCAVDKSSFVLLECSL